MNTRSDSALPAPEAIRAEMARLVAELAPGKSFCPSDVARSLGGAHPDQWSRLMVPVRRTAVEMAKAGALVILRKGKPADPDDFRGVYRLGAPRHD